MVDYDERQHIGFVAGRHMPPSAQRSWMDAFARHLPTSRPLTVLDLGSGTGRMTPALADTFGGPVVGVEPSARMRAQAPPHPAVSYVAGSASSIPLPDAWCDAAVVFFVWHHVPHHAAAVRELHRVVRPGGKVLLQTNFADRMPDVWWFRVVPEWRRADTAQFRTRAEVEADFTGWHRTAHESVTWLRSASLAADYEKLQRRAVSFFDRVPDEVAESGFARIEAALPSLDPGPQHETNELLVFERTP
jgi:ubiquinone/menaquinone biosynthesis C-methylase UbiE